MASKMYNRARMTVTSTGTGALSLGVAVAGYQTFSSAGAQNSDTVSYTIEDGVNWEIGTGQFNSVAGTLSRTVTQSFNGTTYGTSAITVTTNAQVYITALAADIVVSGGALGTPSSGTLTNATGLPLATGVTGTLPVLNGGTGVTTSTGSGNNVLSTSPTLVTPVLGTPTSGTLTNCTGLPVSTGISGLGTGVATALGNAVNGASGICVQDASGNLGLGVTPSAWSGATALQLKNGASAIAGAIYQGAVSGNNANGFTHNAYFDGTNWKYIYSSSYFASRYEQMDGKHTWYNAPASTGTISFTQAMTLDASGNLFAGATSSAATNRAFFYGSGGTTIRVGDATNSAWRGYVIGASSVDSGEYGSLKMNLTTGELQLYVGPNAYGGFQTFYTAGLERARIDSSGTFRVKGAGTAGSTDAFQVNGSAPASAAQIDGSGNLLVGTTSADPNGTTYGIALRTPSGGQQLRMNSSGSTDANIVVLRSSSDILRVNVNGGIANYQANNSNLSDIRLKTNIQLAGVYLDKICAIPVKTFLFKNQRDNYLNLGVIAQDVLNVAPELVNQDVWEDGSDEHYLAIYQTDLQYALMKSIQELAAKVTALEAANG